MLRINISLILRVMLVKYNNTKIKVKPWESGKGLHVLTLPDPTGPMTASSLPCKKTTTTITSYIINWLAGKQQILNSENLDVSQIDT